MGKHPWDVYRSCISDGIIQSTWGDDSYRGICIGLYGGEQIATKWHDEVAYKVYDISEHPIIIDLHVLNTDAVVDIGNIECWDAYLSDLKIYHKDKTADNYWRKYGLISKPSPTQETFIVEHRIGLQDIQSRKYNISPITDFDNFMDQYNNSQEYVSWVFCRPANIDFWDPIKEYYKTHIISWKELSAYGNFGYGIFSSCTLDKLELNFGNIDGDIFMAAHQLIAFSTITELTINVDSNCRVSSLNSLCRNSNIEHLYWKGTSPIVHDLSHLFEGAPNIKTIPDCIKWNETLTGTANLTTSFMGCSKLSRIDCQKGMVCIAGTMPHTFDGCTSITYIEPIFDVSRISPETYGGYNIFKGCTKLYHLKLKGIHGIWRMDGSTHPARQDTWPANSPHTNGDLLSLDTECIKHLFDNALAAKQDEICQLYCPQEWSDKITENMLTSIKSKGWEIYVGNVLQ